MQDYLGIAPRNSATQIPLEPLPEDTDSEMPELEDDSDL